MPRNRQACIVRYQPLDLQTRREAEALVAAGFDTRVLCLRDEGESRRETVNGYDVHRVRIVKKRGSPLRYVLEYLTWFFVGFGWLTVQHIRRPFTVVQVSTLPDTQVFATLVPRLTGAKVVVFLKEPTGELFETLYGSARLGRIMNHISDLGIRFAHLAFTVSDQHSETYTKRGLPANKLVPIVNSVPLTALGVTVADRRPDPDHFVAMCHGTIEDRWGYETILRAAALAHRDIPNLRVIFTGRGTYVERMLELVRELGLEDVVDYRGFVPFVEVGQALMETHVGISGQRPSPYSHVVQTGKMYEFLELGIPAIVTRLRSAAAYFSDEAIFFVEPDNPHDMAKALVTLAQDPARGERMAAAGLREVAQYSWSQEAKRYVAAIEGVVAKS